MLLNTNVDRTLSHLITPILANTAPIQPITPLTVITLPPNLSFAQLPALLFLHLFPHVENAPPPMPTVVALSAVYSRNDLWNALRTVP